MCLVNHHPLPGRPGGGEAFEQVRYQLAACKAAFDELGDLLGRVWPDLSPGTRAAALDHLDFVVVGALDSREQLSIAVADVGKGVAGAETAVGTAIAHAEATTREARA